MELNEMEFKNKISALRTERGLNVTQLAAAFNKSEAAVRAWETGRSKPDTDIIISLSRYFDVSADYLLGIDAFRNKAHVSSVNNATNEIQVQLAFLDKTQLEIVKDMIKAVTHAFILFSGEKYTEGSYIKFLESFNLFFSLCRKFDTIKQRHDRVAFDSEDEKRLEEIDRNNDYNDVIIDNCSFIDNCVKEISRALSTLRLSVFKDIEEHKRHYNPDETIDSLLEYVEKKCSGADNKGENADKYGYYRFFLENLRSEIYYMGLKPQRKDTPPSDEGDE